MTDKNYTLVQAFLNKNSHTEKDNAEAEAVILQMNNNTIHSLKELRENFSLDELLKYHLNGELSVWLNQLYYEREAEDISSIEFEDKNCLERICSVLKIPYEIRLSAEEQEILSEKTEKLRQFTDEACVLSNPQLVAMNQEELALMLDKGFRLIYLCAEEFSIPISVPGVEYVRVADAAVSNPYTEQQYLRAGIKMTGFELPSAEDPDKIEAAMDAARSNGYDDFSDNHSALATAFHEMLKCSQYTTFYMMKYNTALCTKFFSSKYECEKAAREEIKKSYEKAEKIVGVGRTDSVAKKTARVYADYLETVLAPHMELLKKTALMTSSMDTYHGINDLYSKAYKLLLDRFEAELSENAFYYQMYDFNYFAGQAEVEEHDHRTSDNDALRLLEHIIFNSIHYRIKDLYSPVAEIGKDLNEHCTTFFKAAFSEYRNFVSIIENLIDVIGRKLPDREDDESLDEYMSRCCIRLAANG